MIVLAHGMIFWVMEREREENSIYTGERQRGTRPRVIGKDRDGTAKCFWVECISLPATCNSGH